MARCSVSLRLGYGSFASCCAETLGKVESRCLSKQPGYSVLDDAAYKWLERRFLAMTDCSYSSAYCVFLICPVHTSSGRTPYAK